MGTTTFYRDNHIGFDLAPMFDGLRSFRDGAFNLRKLWRIYRIISLIESYAKYAVVDESDLESVEKMLSVIDDTLDDIDDILKKSNIFKKLLLNRIYSKLVNIEFILSNKVADHIGENRQNEPL